MADWTNIPNESLEPDAPVRSIDGLAFRDNPIAIAEGAPGAPRVQAAGLAVGNNERDWVLARVAGTAINAVGSYRMAYYRSSTQLNPGGTVAGSNLRSRPGTTNSEFALSMAAAATSSSLSGTWRLMGHHGIQGDLSASSTPVPAALFLRIS